MSMATISQMRAACIGFCNSLKFPNMDEKQINFHLYIGSSLKKDTYRLMKGGYMFETVADISPDSPDADISLAYCVFIALGPTIGFEPFNYF